MSNTALRILSFSICGILAPEVADMIIAALEKNKQRIMLLAKEGQQNGKVL